MSTIKIKIDRLVFGGQGMGEVDGKKFFVWNALPGETVEARVTKNKPDYGEAVTEHIITSSPQRRDARENHFLSCSPWQILDFSKENKWKERIIQEAFARENVDLSPDAIVTDGVEYGYRNKMEFSFWSETENDLSLAFFSRGGKRKIPILGCCLAKNEINQVAQDIRDQLAIAGIRGWHVKSLIVRATQKGMVHAALFIKKDDISLPEFVIEKPLESFTVYYSTHKSPASVPTTILSRYGNDELTDDIGECVFSYSPLSFFQVNVPVYVLALKDIAQWVESGRVVDVYSGVGSIGLSIARQASELVLIENDTFACASAKKNSKMNGYDHAQIIEGRAEDYETAIDSDSTVIVDPPRAGLHHRIIEQLKKARPRTMMYLSCNLSTQARDIALLADTYSVVCSRGYNFFPHTPHIEHLVVLKVR